MSDDPETLGLHGASADPNLGIEAATTGHETGEAVANGQAEIPQAEPKSQDLDAFLAEVTRPPEWLDAFLADQAQDLAQLLTDLGTLDLTSLDDLPLPSLDDLGLPPLTL